MAPCVVTFLPGREGRQEETFGCQRRKSRRFCLSEETKDDISLDLLDDVAMFQIQKLTRLMDYLSSKAKPTDE
ncbi:unnamed protein product [Boreogadus saida]